MSQLPTTQKLKVTCADRDFLVATKSRLLPSDVLIVFIHGIGCAKECFDEAFSIKGLESFSILTFDLIGFGESDKPDDFGYGMDDHANIAKLVIDQLSPQKVVLVAHSMSGTIGIPLAQKLDNLTSFINVEGNLVPEDSGIVSRKTADQGEADFVSTGFPAFLNKLKTADSLSYRTWGKWYEQSNPKAIYRSAQSLVKWSDDPKTLEYFNSLPKKSYISGDQTDNEYLSKQLKGVTTYRILNSGHFMMLDNPKMFYEAVLKELGVI